jgi:hypothetical protein
MYETRPVRVPGVIDPDVHSAISVCPFESRGGNADEARRLTDVVEDWLQRHVKDIKVIERELIEVPGEAWSNCLELEVLTHLEAVYEVTAVVHATLYADRRWSIELVDTKTAQVLWKRMGLGSLGSVDANLDDVLAPLVPHDEMRQAGPLVYPDLEPWEPHWRPN